MKCNRGDFMMFEVKECSETETIKNLFVEYSHIKGAESCFVSFDKELNDLAGYYSGGAILVGYEEDKPVACVAVRKISDETCEGKRLFIKSEYRGKGYARIMIKAMTDKASELGFKEVVFTTKPEVMTVGYGLYKRMGFEELSENNGIVSMRIDLSKTN
jgi:GNAT superfamily N-acetyltransferase